jgi:hypothetical protein
MKDNSDLKQEFGERGGSMGTTLLSESAIRRVVLLDAAQHPAALLPLAACFMSAVYLVLLSSLFGGRLVVIVVLATTGVVGAAALAWQFFTLYPEMYARYVRDSMERRDRDQDRAEEAEASKLRENLREEFDRIGSTEGATTLGRISDEYEQLRLALETQVETSSFLLPNLSTLADGRTAVG